MRRKRVKQKLKNIKTSLSAGGNDRPYSFAPLSARFAPSALSDPSVNHHKANGLLCHIIGRLNVWRGNELKVMRPMLFKAVLHILSFIRLGNVLRSQGHQRIPALRQRVLKYARGHLLTTMNHVEQGLQSGTKPFAIGFGVLVTQRGQIFHISNQMSQAELDLNLVIQAHIFTIGAKIITPNDATEFFPEDIEQHLAPARLVETKQRIHGRLEAPRPEPVTVVLVSGLINMKGGLGWKRSQQFIKGGFQGVSHFGNHVPQVAPRHRHGKHISTKFPDGTERGMTDAFHIRDQGRQSRAKQAAFDHLKRQWRIMDRSTVGTPKGVSAMFCDMDGEFQNLDLLDDARGLVGLFEVGATTGTGVQRMLNRVMDLLRRKRGAFMFRMSWLSSSASLRGVRWLLGGLCRLDNIARWRFRGGPRILPRLRQFSFKMFNAHTKTLIFLHECRDDVFEILLSHVTELSAPRKRCQL